ncbi:FAD-dependent oxidoreductase (GlcD/DLD_GlcF/GlpC domain fusion protein) [Natronomonas pharaonis DSM 2160]|uniref:D-lactate dehydrogenase (cytochrome) n=1 Tax=Natronomonas pharaonis (strain ATCC 35678 / DSM 2160 / CIP 103997 / JCM 8858 / NBRC 14720 / NCIMB 2260 / Gabara) TaxID=348780 RepID=A0A1U7EUY2_NATPD|nr:FAD-binding and (Fe-S)-binding domain-containing protein [Natronomonas pharaonis]CAI48817.1 FAD-dependent oxidoreductase (GlcD/DLD_GlcF/GlpC domain fusion protein) [Natronomonas pharaonis DSM 2160]
MATEGGDRTTGTDPAVDERASYDYTGGDTDRPGLVADLKRLIDGEVRFDEYTRTLYATDASAYEVTPIGVVFPTDTDDVSAVVSYCAERSIPVLPRGGGTSLAGQTVNKAVVVDFTRHMNSLLTVDEEARTATAQPGVRLGDLDKRLDGLTFPPDPAWGDKSALGGAIGNNSTGSHSLVYGKTDAYIESLEVVLADGSVHRFGPVTPAEWQRRAEESSFVGRIYRTLYRIASEEAEPVETAYPELKRNVSGYNLDCLIEQYEAAVAGDRETVNLARVLAGSEGTLGVVTEATVGLEPTPETKAVALLSYPGLIDALEDVEPILSFGPAAVEVLDDVLLDLARDTSEFGALVEETLPSDAGSVLLVEFYAESDADGKRRVAELLADRRPSAETTADSTGGPTTDAPVRAIHADEAHEKADRERFWKLRKSGLPILLGRTTDEKHISFIEDTAVPPENLPEYVAEFRELLEANDTFASFYAHAGPGCLHIRPLVDTKTTAGIEQMDAIAEGATDLVAEYDGSVSGEHGDGRARTRWNRKLYGDEVFGLFEELKAAFDPDGILNPEQVCGDVDPTEALRFDPDYEFDPGFEPALRWDNDNGFQGMAELCHGCGGCRGPQETTGGVMCPTYRAADEEIQSTRGRANALRAAASGRLDAAATDPEFMREVLDLCIGCKGCSNDCPSEVDLAKLKAEVTYQHHREHGASLRDRLFANIDTVAALGSRLAPLVNRLSSLPGSGRIAEKALGIARERSPPTFERESFVDWFERRDPTVAVSETDHRVVLLPDTFTNYVDTDVAKAAVRVLEAAGVHVDIVEAGGTGRAAYSKGFVETAAERAQDTVEAVEPYVEDGWSVVVCEPSDAVMVQSDYASLLPEATVEHVAENTYGVCEYLDVAGLDGGVPTDAGGEQLVYHGHCHQKATKRDHHAVGVLRRAGYDVTPLDSTCCGMAGSFGYEAEHYSMSQAIGSLLFDRLDDADGRPVAPGASCRTQLSGDGRTAVHPIECLAAAIPEPNR